MDSNPKKNPYKDALDEATMELHRILDEYEKLCIPLEQTDKVIKALNPATRSAAQIEWGPVEHRDNLDGLTVVTRLTVVRVGQGS